MFQAKLSFEQTDLSLKIFPRRKFVAIRIILEIRIVETGLCKYVYFIFYVKPGSCVQYERI